MILRGSLCSAVLGLPVGFDRVVLGEQVCDFPPESTLSSGRLVHSVDCQEGNLGKSQLELLIDRAPDSHEF